MKEGQARGFFSRHGPHEIYCLFLFNLECSAAAHAGSICLDGYSVHHVTLNVLIFISPCVLLG
jgi:hypothetical protein